MFVSIWSVDADGSASKPQTRYMALTCSRWSSETGEMRGTTATRDLDRKGEMCVGLGAQVTPVARGTLLEAQF